jgi:hypothetical protein
MMLIEEAACFISPLHQQASSWKGAEREHEGIMSEDELVYNYAKVAAS